MSDTITVVVSLPNEVWDDRVEKTYQLSQFELLMMLECNEFIWPDYSDSECVFVTRERALFTNDGRLSSIHLMMFSTLHDDR